MSRYNRLATATTARPLGPAAAVGSTAPSYEGGTLHGVDHRTELFTLAACNIAGAGSFYESGTDRDTRFLALIRHAAVNDSAWCAGLIKWLRGPAGIRTAALVAAGAYAHANGPASAAVIDSALLRADEPGEFLAMWRATYGRELPRRVRAGLAMAVVRLYNERSAVKWDTNSAAYSFGAMIRIVHPKPADPKQAKLFAYLIGKDRGRPARFEDLMPLPLLSRTLAFETIPADQRRARLGEVEGTAFTWERLAGWLSGGMDAEAWEAAIPFMGQMALLRNLRNFAEKGISAHAVAAVNRALALPARHGPWPHQVYTAWVNSGTAHFAPGIEAALDNACAAIPEFSGRTLILVDHSTSMEDPLNSEIEDPRSLARRREGGAVTLDRASVAAVFAGAVATRNPGRCDVISYDIDSRAVPTRGTSALRVIDAIRSYFRGGGTDTWEAVTRHYRGHDRVLILTDEQNAPSDFEALNVPACPIYVWNLAGYAGGSMLQLGRGRHLFGGFSPACFPLITMLESYRNVGWDGLLAAR